MQIFAKFVRLLHTILFLKFVQIWTRIRYRFTKPKIDLAPSAPLRLVLGTWTRSCAKHNFFNEHTNANQDALWQYNCHYLDHPSDEQITKWISDNSPGAGVGWDSYPTSMRIVNWIKWHLSGNPLSYLALDSLAVQTRYLTRRLEYHLLGNHLMANAKALIFSGLFFDGDEAQEWLSAGQRILREQIAEQILPDGGHFERSAMYHSIILEDLMDLINLYRTVGKEVPTACLSKVGQMREWLQAMCHPDGQISLFNDSAFEIATSPAELEAYAKRLSLDPISFPRVGLTQLKSSGYIRWQKEQAVALLDVAPIGPDYLPGHAHADTLTFELSVNGRRMIVDSGTSCYGSSTERLRQRSTAAHNTVEIDGEDSSEVWSGFRVARRAYPINFQIADHKDTTKVRCAHTGYKRLASKNIHTREWQLSENFFFVSDRLSGSFNRAVSRFFFHPEVKVSGDIGWQIEGGTDRVVESTWHPRFGVSIPNKCLEIEWFAPACSVRFEW